MTSLCYAEVESPVGPLLLAASDDAIHVIGFSSGKKKRSPDPTWKKGENALIREARTQLADYFAGERRAFDLPLEPIGSAFQRAVWGVVRDIPYAETISYGEVARRIDRPAAARAVGAACGENPLPIAIPCHRVVGKNGTLTGFGGGLDAKETLLELERACS